jgi:predicted RNase H-like HicB family nuclease
MAKQLLTDKTLREPYPREQAYKVADADERGAGRLLGFAARRKRARDRRASIFCGRFSARRRSFTPPYSRFESLCSRAFARPLASVMPFLPAESYRSIRDEPIDSAATVEMEEVLAPPGRTRSAAHVASIQRPKSQRRAKCLLGSTTVLVRATWDPEASVYVAESDDVPGLATEAESLDALIVKLTAIIPELLELNDGDLSPQIPFELLARPRRSANTHC